MSNTTITPQSTPNRRNTELMMLGFAVLVPVLAYANVGLARDDSLPAGLVSYGLGLGLMAGIAHLVVRKFAPYADPLLLPLATFLNGMGLVMIFRLDSEKTEVSPRTGKLFAYAQAPSQLMWTAIGVALFIGVCVFLKDHRVLQRYTYISLALALVLLVSPLPFPPVFGARIWIKAGPFSFQPGEFTKIVLVVFFSGYLMVKRDALALASRKVMGLYFPRGRDLGPVLVVWVLSMLILVFERDLGTSLLFFGLFIVMLYVATERTSWLLMGVGMAAVGAVAVGSFLSHVKTRVDAWIDPFAVYGPNPPPAGAGTEQIAQSLYGLGSGGILGTGWGQGYAGSEVRFAVKSDFILSSFGEELGLAGLMAIFVVYALLIERGFRTALAARDPFGKLLAAGLSIVLGLQIFIVAGGVIGLIPLTGMTMPFLAQGGSSIVTNWIVVALLVVVSHTARRPAPPVERGQVAAVQNSRGGRRRAGDPLPDVTPAEGVAAEPDPEYDPEAATSMSPAAPEHAEQGPSGTEDETTMSPPVGRQPADTPAAPPRPPGRPPAGPPPGNSPFGNS